VRAGEGDQAADGPPTKKPRRRFSDGKGNGGGSGDGEDGRSGEDFEGGGGSVVHISQPARDMKYKCVGGFSNFQTESFCIDSADKFKECTLLKNTGAIVEGDFLWMKFVPKPPRPSLIFAIKKPNRAESRRISHHAPPSHIVFLPENCKGGKAIIQEIETVLEKQSRLQV